MHCSIRKLKRYAGVLPDFSANTVTLITALVHYTLFLSQCLGNSGPEGAEAQLMTVNVVVYAMARKPRTQSTTSDARHSLLRATALRCSNG
jgi:hypothetical protein